MSDILDPEREAPDSEPTSGDDIDTAASPRTRRRIKIGAWLVGFVVIVAVVWKYGGSNVSFDVDATADPDKKFDWDFFFALIPDFLEALWVTVQATIGGIAVAVALGLILALGRRAQHRSVSWSVAFFIEFVRSTPLLIQLYFLFYALPRVDFLPESARVLTPLTALIIGIGIHYGCYCSEAYRAGIDSVPKGQWEAATAMNLKPRTTWTNVILPQAIPNVLPALGNYLIAGFKDAPLGSSIQVTGVLFFARTVSGRTFRPVEAYTMVGLGFLAVSIPAAFLIRRLERRIGYDRQ